MKFHVTVKQEKFTLYRQDLLKYVYMLFQPRQSRISQRSERSLHPQSVGGSKKSRFVG